MEMGSNQTGLNQTWRMGRNNEEIDGNCSLCVIKGVDLDGLRIGRIQLIEMGEERTCFKEEEEKKTAKMVMGPKTQ